MADASEQTRQRVVQGIRALAGAQSELGRLFARTRHMHTTDASAMLEILTAEDRGQPITPARLAQRIGLTTGATSTLLNRLEDAGHVRRSREHTDRRVVTLHSTPDIHAAADAFFRPLEHQLGAVLAGYSAAELTLFVGIVDGLRETMSAYPGTLESVPED